MLNPINCPFCDSKGQTNKYGYITRLGINPMIRNDDEYECPKCGRRMIIKIIDN